MRIVEVAARPTAVVAATTTWQQFPALWRELSSEVWDCLRAGGINRGCPNVMLYLDDQPRVEIGVLLDQPCPLTGRVVSVRPPEWPGGDGRAHRPVLRARRCPSRCTSTGALSRAW